MRVKITQCSNPIFWYNQQVGSILNVEMANNGYSVIGCEDVHANRYVLRHDCEILPEETPQPEPFDLERALKGEPFISMDGKKKFQVVAPSMLFKDLHIVETVTDNDPRVERFNMKGVHPDYHYMAPKEPQVVTKYVNIYHNTNHDDFNCGIFFPVEASAIENGKTDKDYIKTIPVTFTI